MPCAGTSCHQGRAECRSPLICEQGLHRHEGPFHDHTPLPTPEDCEQIAGWLYRFIVIAGIFVILACVVGPLYFGVTP